MALRLGQVAEELNISHQEIEDYLRECEYLVRGINTKITDEMYNNVLEQFQPDKISAEQKLNRKRKELAEKTKSSEIKPIYIPIVALKGDSKGYILDVIYVTEELKEAVTEVELPVKTEAEKIEIEVSGEKPVELPVIIIKEPKRVPRRKEERDTGETLTKEPQIEIPESEVSAPDTKAEKAAHDKVRKLSAKGRELTEKQRERKEKRQKGELDEDSDLVTEKKHRRRRRHKRKKIDEKEVEASIKETLTYLEIGKVKKKYKRAKEQVAEIEEVEEKIIRVSEFISVAELAHLMEVDSKDVIKKSLEMGQLVTVNQTLDFDTIRILADEFGYEVELLPEYGQDLFEDEDEYPENLMERSPIVTIMGHVDHGKTSLLDFIRKSNIVAGERGSITQHIGAYVVNCDSRNITFLDTPGHEAFTAMRARGAQVTDIVVLIVAADDNVMPQTLEAIDHAKSAQVPIIIAINKIDKPNADPERIKKQLADKNVLVESWGGKYPSIEISAKTGEGVEDLLEIILLQADILELKANPNRTARGFVIESKLDKGRGPVATVLIQNGTLNQGDSFIAGQYNGRVRALLNERGKKVPSAIPAFPVQVLGFNGLPGAGDSFFVLKNEQETKEISLKRQQIKREREYRRTQHITLDEISRRIKIGGFKELFLIVKADTNGSVEALTESLLQIENDEVSINIVHQGVGEISESDVLLASASESIIIGFHVRPNLKTRELAKREHVDIRFYDVIYDAISDVKKALEGLLEPEEKEEISGVAEVREIFKIPRVGNVAGSYIVSGKIIRNDRIRLIRDGLVITETRVKTLRRFKDDVREVTSGFECGVGLENFNDIKIGDTLETFRIVEVKKIIQ